MAELAALVRDLERGPEIYASRIARLEGHTGWIPTIIEQSRPIATDCAGAGAPRDNDAPGSGRGRP